MTTIKQAFESIEHTSTQSKVFDNPCIYVACLAAYNNGYLHGKWIDYTNSVESIQEEINEMLKDSPVTKLYGEIAEEWDIHDHSGFYGWYDITNTNDLCNISEVACTIAESDDPELLIGLMSHLGSGASLDDAKEYLDDKYAGLHNSILDYTYSFLESTGELDTLPKHLHYYFDYESYARDIEINDVFTIETSQGVHVFYNQ